MIFTVYLCSTKDQIQESCCLNITKFLRSKGGGARSQRLWGTLDTLWKGGGPRGQSEAFAASASTIPQGKGGLAGYPWYVSSLVLLGEGLVKGTGS